MFETITTQLVAMECGQCGSVFAMSEAKHRRCKANGESWYCPNGHCRVYTDTENKQLKDQLTREKQFREQAEASQKYWRAEATHADRRAIAQKAAKTRLKNRIANGVCPCCTRHFTNVQRHIKDMHPEYKASEA